MLGPLTARKALPPCLFFTFHWSPPPPPSLQTVQSTQTNKQRQHKLNSSLYLDQCIHLALWPAPVPLVYPEDGLGQTHMTCQLLEETFLLWQDTCWLRSLEPLATEHLQDQMKFSSRLCMISSEKKLKNFRHKRRGKSKRMSVNWTSDYRKINNHLAIGLNTYQIKGMGSDKVHTKVSYHQCFQDGG